MTKLESLKAVTALSFLPDYVQNRVDELSSLGVMSLGPVVSCSRLSEHKVVRSEDLAERSGSNRIHGSRFQVHKDSTGDVLSSGSLVEVNIDPLQLKVGVSVVGSSWVNAMLVRDDLEIRIMFNFDQATKHSILLFYREVYYNCGNCNERVNSPLILLQSLQEGKNYKSIGNK